MSLVKTLYCDGCGDVIPQGAGGLRVDLHQWTDADSKYDIAVGTAISLEYCRPCARIRFPVDAVPQEATRV